MPDGDTVLDDHDVLVFFCARDSELRTVVDEWVQASSDVASSDASP